MDKQIRENISKLKAKGFLGRKGPDRGGKWVILKVNNESNIKNI
jgi:predicted HTH transcriptional regulator